MSFESGSTTFRMFYLPKFLPEDYVERFQSKAVPPLATLGPTPIRGWVTGRHDLDRMISRETITVAGYLRLALMTAERKVSPSFLRAEQRIEEIARQNAEQRTSLDRKTRAEIRKEVHERLQAVAQPQIKAISIVHAPGSGVLYAETSSEKQMDAFEAAFRETMGFGLIPADETHAAQQKAHVDVRSLTPVSFSPDCDDDAMEQTPGRDFLTWLWFISEYRGGTVTMHSDRWAMCVEGPLGFAGEGNGAHETWVRRGTPEISAEAKIALLSGKKLYRARLMFGRGEDAWQVTFDADRFLFRGLKLPEGDALDPVDRFQERMAAINTFTSLFYNLYGMFLQERTGDTWTETKADIHRWVSERKGQK
jgi:recombination associated protein RdgC